MKNIPIVLSVLALALSIAALVGGAGMGTQAKAPRKILADSGKMQSAEVQPCTGSGAADNLQLLMRHRINPMMTRLSFALYHDERPAAERLDVVADAAAVLLGCVEVTPSYRPEIGLDGLPEYYRLLERMQANTLALQTSARESDEPGTRHWFSHLKHDCNECHSRFRLAAEGDVAFTEDVSHDH